MLPARTSGNRSAGWLAAFSSVDGCNCLGRVHRTMGRERNASRAVCGYYTQHAFFAARLPGILPTADLPHAPHMRVGVQERNLSILTATALVAVQHLLSTKCLRISNF